MPPVRTPLRGFQDAAVGSAVQVLSHGMDLLARVGAGAANEAVIVAEYGSVLFEAPTGSGKTLMACETIDRLNSRHDMLWIWLAPFAGVVGQTADVLRDEYPSLPVRDLATTRQAEQLVKGAVYVTTWAAVASRSQDRRARQPSEQQLSVDELVASARARGFFVGVVIDEAHHSFRTDNLAFDFFKTVLQPEVSILVTATPRDRDIDLFVEKHGVTRLNRISVSRKDAVAARLLKEGVRVGIFSTGSEERDRLLDYRSAALQCGLQVHRAIKAVLAQLEVPLVPLMLVQVDSASGSVHAARDRLVALGAPGTAIRIHTSADPDPELRRIAADSSAEFLIFKMAVATGFDAPRAFTLVSMRSNRDVDFGTQVVGRLMRMPRELQGMAQVPEQLNNGYVFLSDDSVQEGIVNAAARINDITTELATVSDHVIVTMIGTEFSAQNAPSGQPTMFPGEASGASKFTSPPADRGEWGNTFGGALLDLFGFEPTTGTATTSTTPSSNSDPSAVHYPLRGDLHYPRRLLTVKNCPREDEVLRSLIEKLKLDDELLGAARTSTMPAYLRMTDVFAGREIDVTQIMAEMTDSELARTAQYNLELADRFGVMDPAAVLAALQNALGVEFQRRGLPEANDPAELRRGISRILSFYEKRFRRAFRAALNENLVVEEAAELPSHVVSEVPLAASRFNIYGVIPSDLNSWELPFARLLDLDTTGVVQWWHRNPPRKPWSVAIPVPGYDNFFPDFVAGINARTGSQDGILLIETKERATDMELEAEGKVRTRHPAYGSAMMLYLDGTRWRVVEYDEIRDRNVLGAEFDATLCRLWGLPAAP